MPDASAPKWFPRSSFTALFSSDMLSVTAAGDEGWRLLKNPYDSIEYTNTTVFNGKVLAVTKFEGIYSWDMEGGAAAEPTLLQGPEELFTDDPNFKREFYLFALSDGGELQVVCMYDYIVKNSHTFGILLKVKRTFFYA